MVLRVTVEVVFDEAVMKWKMVFSGQEECWRTERMAAIEPRRYFMSSVIATWTATSEQTTKSMSMFVVCSDEIVRVDV